MEQQPSDLESQVKRIADSIERVEQCYLRQATAYDEDRKKYEDDTKKWDRQRLVERTVVGLINSFVFWTLLADPHQEWRVVTD